MSRTDPLRTPRPAPRAWTGSALSVRIPARLGPIFAVGLVALLPVATSAQSPERTSNHGPTIERIFELGMNQSQLPSLAQVLFDSIGPRLTGSPGQEAAAQWALRTYTTWGIEARNEEYGTWRGWRRGITHVDLIEPRVRSLDAILLAWSSGSGGMTRGEVVALPEFSSPADLDRFASSVSGKFVLLDPPQPTCRPDDNWEEWAMEGSLDRMRETRSEIFDRYNASLTAVTGERRGGKSAVAERLAAAGAAGFLTSNWSRGWGVQKVFDISRQVGDVDRPGFDVGCEDYGLLFRLAENGQHPLIQVHAEAEHLGEIPVANTIAVLPGNELPDEYVVLSAHFDSWDGGSGATDNGTGTITMMEAMRILKEVYPNPKRTIIAGHWNGEEQGLNGSRAFAWDHPEIVGGLQVLLNQDNGTGRIANVSMQGLTAVQPYWERWMAQIPEQIAGQVNLRGPGTPGTGGSDYASFICAGAPAFGLSSLSWDYGTYTWHTNRDTYDKLSFDDLRHNATLVAMLAYLASEEPDRLPRDQIERTPQGEEFRWPQCRDGRRSSGN